MTFRGGTLYNALGMITPPLTAPVTTPSSSSSSSPMTQNSTPISLPSSSSPLKSTTPSNTLVANKSQPINAVTETINGSILTKREEPRPMMASAPAPKEEQHPKPPHNTDIVGRRWILQHPSGASVSVQIREHTRGNFFLDTILTTSPSSLDEQQKQWCIQSLPLSANNEDSVLLLETTSSSSPQTFTTTPTSSDVDDNILVQPDGRMVIASDNMQLGFRLRANLPQFPSSTDQVFALSVRNDASKDDWTDCEIKYKTQN